MGAAQWQNFHKNLITIVGNKYVQGFLDNTVGAMFSGTWTPGDGLTGFGGQFSTIWKKNYTDNVTGESTGAQKFGYGALGVVNSALNVVGNLAAIYNLASAPLRTSSTIPSSTLSKFDSLTMLA